MGCLGKAEVAKKIGVKIRKLEYMLHDGEFPPGVQIGKSLAWLEEVVDAWLDAQFAPQREWMRRAAAGAKSGQTDPVPAMPVTHAAAKNATPSPRVITTTLSAAGVPAPVRLV